MNTQIDKAMDFWGRVENAQKAKGWTLLELCQRAGLNYGTIMNKRSTAKLPNLEAGVAIAKVLERSVEWLLYGDEASEPVIQLETIRDIYNDKKLLHISKELGNASDRQIDAIQVILRIEN